MNKIYKTALGVAAIVMAASCSKYEPLGYEVDKPESVTLQEDINSYDGLLSYINQSAHPNFKLGAALSLSTYVNKSVMYRLANRNFNEIVMGWEMKHGGVVQPNGSLALENVENLMGRAQEAGMPVFGRMVRSPTGPKHMQEQASRWRIWAWVPVQKPSNWCLPEVLLRPRISS